MPFERQPPRRPVTWAGEALAFPELIAKLAISTYVPKATICSITLSSRRGVYLGCPLITRTVQMFDFGRSCAYSDVVCLADGRVKYYGSIEWDVAIHFRHHRIDGRTSWIVACIS